MKPIDKQTSKLPDGLREFDDPVATRNLIYDNMLESVSKRFPIEDDDYRLELTNVKYGGPKDFSLEQQKRALMTNHNLTTPITGTWKLIQKSTGKVLDKRDDTVMRVPYYTNRGTFINNGSEYTVISQSRLKPGAYTRRRRDGNLETHFNVKSGTGYGFRIEMNPKTGTFDMTMGQAHLPLYHVLKSMGMSDKKMLEAWGPDIARANAERLDAQTLQKMYQKMMGSKAVQGATVDEMSRAVVDKFAKSELDPDIVARTMGMRNMNHVTPELMLRATNKMLDVNRGDAEPDNRDNPRFSDIYSVEDLLRERVDKDAGRLSKNLMFRAKRDKSLHYINRNALNPYLDNFLHGSGLAMPGEETNPMSNLEQMTRITKFGEGGIRSADAVTEEARDVNGDYLGFVDPIQGPESGRIGVDVRTSYRTFKGRDNKLYGEFLDPRSSRKAYVDIGKAADSVVAFPGQDMTKPYVYAMRNNVPTKVKTSDVDYVVPTFAHMVASNINLNPMPTAVQAGRQFYGAKFWSQFLPQSHGEVPLVDSLMPDSDTTFSEYYGRKMGTMQSDVDGVVTKVTDKAVTIKGADGKPHTVEMVRNFPFNRLSYISYFPTVKVGDSVKAGGMVAHSNYTDKKTGAVAMGQNLKVAIIPSAGDNFEDGITISESAAKRLSTSRMYGFDQDKKNGVTFGRKKYMSMFPDKFTKDQFNTLDDNGVAKVGTILRRGDPIILSIGPKLLSSQDAQLGRLGKVLKHSVTDKADVWEHDWPGVVADTAMTASGVKVNVVSEPPVQVGDKLSPRFGLKGVVSAIYKDDEMPRDSATNEPYEIMMNPMGFLSRVAPGQIMEIALAKVAKATGKQVRLPQLPPPEGWGAWVKKQMDAAGVKESADIFDPKTGKTIKNIGDGYVYMQAFHHLAEKKESARGIESAYDQDEQPARGGHDGAKRFSNLDVNAALAHGATDLIKDAITIKGTRNEDYWNALRLGLPLPEPKVPFIYDKFLNTLRAGGINVIEKGNLTAIMPQTDKDIDKMSGGHIIDSSEMVDNDFEPVKGGLFDLGKTGGMGGSHWSAIKLPEPVPNPIMEEPVRRVLGLTTKRMEAILSGAEKLNGKTGGVALKDALSNVDVDKMISDCRDQIGTRRGASRDNAIKVLRYLESMKGMGMKPSDWMISKIPVLPPKFRPVSRMGDVALVSDINDLYKDVLENAHSFSELHKDLPDEDTTEERLNIYNSVKAAYGLGSPITPEGQAKGVKGAIRQVIGTVPKRGMFQHKVISKTQDAVGRGVVSADPNLDMDQIGIPEETAWSMYKPFVTRALVRRGYTPVNAMNMIEARDKTAMHLLEEEMSRRPIIMDRAPTWHKFNLLAFNPHIAHGKTVRVCPLIVSGFNMDFDGDTVNVHVPVSEKAVKQARERMMPSKNLISLTDLRSPRHPPSKEQIYGLYSLTAPPTAGKRVRRFKTAADARKAYTAGEIEMNDPIEIG